MKTTWLKSVFAIFFSVSALAEPPTKSHADMRKIKTISIWVGQLKTENQIDTYLSSEFQNDWGFRIDPSDGPEANYSEQAPAPVESLLSEVSWGRAFSKSVAVSLAKQGITEVSSILVFYNFKYDPKLSASKQSGQMKFVGSFPFQHPDSNQ